MTRQGRDRLAGGVLLVFAGLWCWGVIATVPDMGGGSRVGPRGFPLTLGLLLAALSALLIVSSFLRAAPDALDELKSDGPSFGVELWAVLSTLAILVGYTAAMYAFGFLVATVVVVGATLALILGKRDWRFVSAMSVGTALTVYIVFNKILGVYLPHGRWIDLWF